MESNAVYMVMRNFPRYLKTSIRFTQFVFVTAIFYIVACMPRWLRKFWYPPVAIRFCKSFLRFLDINLVIHHQENLYRFPQVIYISNHPSKIEMPLIYPLVIYTTDILASREDSLSIPILGYIFSASTNIFVNTKLSSDYQALRTLIKKIKEGRSIWILPEGRISPHIEKFENGAFYLSSKSKLPIVPIYIKLSDKQAFECDHSLNLVQFASNIRNSPNRRIDVYCFEPVQPTNYLDAESYCQEVHAQYLNWEKNFNMPVNCPTEINDLEIAL